MAVAEEVQQHQEACSGELTFNAFVLTFEVSKIMHFHNKYKDTNGPRPLLVERQNSTHFSGRAFLEELLLKSSDV